MVVDDMHFTPTSRSSEGGQRDLRRQNRNTDKAHDLAVGVSFCDRFEARRPLDQPFPICGGGTTRCSSLEPIGLWIRDRRWGNPVHCARRHTQMRPADVDGGGGRGLSEVMNCKRKGAAAEGCIP